MDTKQTLLEGVPVSSKRNVQESIDKLQDFQEGAERGNRIGKYRSFS